MINRILYSFLLSAFLITFHLLAPSFSEAKAKPDITRCEVQYVNSSIHVSVHWQSANPVTMVKIYLARDPKEIPVDEYDNKRNARGYSGEVSTVIPLEQFQAESLVYIVQVEDELRQKSDQVTGKVQIAKRSGGTDDLWGSSSFSAGATGNQTGMSIQPTGKTEIVDKLISVIDRVDLAPTISFIKVGYIALDRVNFNIRLSDDKNLSQLILKIMAENGNTVQEQTITGMTGKFWEGYSSTFTLPVGNYRVNTVAVDAGGNTSKEKSESFNVTQSVSPAADPEPTQIPYKTAAQTANSSTQTTGQTGTTGTSTDLLQDLNSTSQTGQTTQSTSPLTPSVITNPPQSTSTQGDTGYLTVTIQPGDVVNLGAMWRVDGGQWQMAGMTVSGLSSGQHTIEFNDVAGWNKPSNQTVTIQPLQSSYLEGTYTK